MARLQAASELAFYILNLWMRAWTEAPAGSIEDDDDVLADAAMCPPDKFGQVKEDALRGWVLCSDGRWYHPTVCEIALETWEKRTGAEKKRAEDRERKRREREALRQSDGVQNMSGGKDQDKDDCPSENALKGREGKGKGREEVSIHPAREDHAFDQYNAMAARIGLPQVQARNDTRRKALRARLDECGGLEGWEVALAKAEASDFLRGKNRDNWQADFDFLIQRKSFTKLMEGSYDNRTCSTGKTGTQSRDTRARESHLVGIAEALAERRG